MSLRVSVILAFAATAGAFLYLDQAPADPVATAPGPGRAVPPIAAPLPAPAPAAARSPQQGWFAVVPAATPEPAGRPPGPLKIRNAADVVSSLPRIHAVHPSLLGKVHIAPPASAPRAGDRIEQRRLQPRSGDALPARYGDTVARY